MTSALADQIHACTLILTQWRTVSLFLVQVLTQHIYVQYRAFIPPWSAWMMDRTNIIISLTPGAQNIVKKCNKCCNKKSLRPLFQKPRTFPLSLCVSLLLLWRHSRGTSQWEERLTFVASVRVFTLWAAGSICLGTEMQQNIKQRGCKEESCFDLDNWEAEKWNILAREQDGSQSHGPLAT